MAKHVCRQDLSGVYVLGVKRCCDRKVGDVTRGVTHNHGVERCRIVAVHCAVSTSSSHILCSPLPS